MASNQRSRLYQRQSPRQPSPVQLQLLFVCLILCWSATHAFVPSTTTTTSSFRHDYDYQQSAQQQGKRRQQRRTPSALFATLPDVASMSVADMRTELDGYGISSKAFLEKRELIDAVEKARAEGKTTTTTTTTKKTEASSSSSSGSRQDKLDAYLEKANKMKASELLQALKEMGVNTKSFFEKRELVQAYAEAMVDGGGQSNNKQQQKTNGAEQERHDPSYRDVVMQKFDPRDPNLAGSRIIDVKAY